MSVTLVIVAKVKEKIMEWISRTFPSPLPIKLQDNAGVPINITGVPAEEFTITIIDKQTHNGQEGKGKFVIINPFMGQLDYKWSEEELQTLPQRGSLEIKIEHRDGVAGTAEQYSSFILTKPLPDEF